MNQPRRIKVMCLRSQFNVPILKSVLTYALLYAACRVSTSLFHYIALAPDVIQGFSVGTFPITVVSQFSTVRMHPRYPEYI